MTKNVNTDIISGIAGLVFMGFFWFSREGVTRLSIMFPNALLILIGLFSVALIIKGLIRAERGAVFTEGNRVRIAVTAAALFGWVLAIVIIGFYVGSLIVFCSLAYYLASARQKVTLPKFIYWVAIVAVQIAIFYLVFSKMLYVPLPKGLFF